MAIDIAMDLEKHRLVKNTVLERTYVKIVQPLSDPPIVGKIYPRDAKFLETPKEDRFLNQKEILFLFFCCCFDTFVRQWSIKI